MICPYCGTENRNLAKFCDYCGQELPSVARDAYEMFDDDTLLIEGQDAVTVDLQGLERMVDSSNSGVMYGTLDTSSQYDADYEEGYTATIPLDPNAQVIADPYGAAPADPYAVPDSAATAVIPAVAPYRTAEFDAVSAGSKGAYPSSSSKVFSADESAKKKGSGNGAKKGKIAIIVAAIVVVLALAAAFITYSLQLWGGVSVPDVVRMSEQSATQALEEAGFGVDVEYVVSDDEEGIVISTNPNAGRRIEEGSVVMISVSKPRVIPQIVGLTKDEAAKLLADSGYEDIEYVTQKSNEPEGNVIAVEPGVDEVAVADTHVVVTVAEPFRVPSVEGMTKDEAVAALEAEGYVVKTATYITEDVAEGMAVSTDPGAGVALNSGSEVILNIAHNRSTELIEATKAFFSAHKQFTLNGMNYELGEVKSVTYQGSDTCAYTISARPYETHTWLFGDTETRYGNYETLNGTITFNADNSVKSTDPKIG